MVKHIAQEGDPLPNICISLAQARKIACLRGLSASLLLLLLLPSTLEQCSPSQIVPAPCSGMAEPLGSGEPSGCLRLPSELGECRSSEENKQQPGMRAAPSAGWTLPCLCVTLCCPLGVSQHLQQTFRSS